MRDNANVSIGILQLHRDKVEETGKFLNAYGDAIQEKQALSKTINELKDGLTIAEMRWKTTAQVVEKYWEPEQAKHAAIISQNNRRRNIAFGIGITAGALSGAAGMYWWLTRKQPRPILQ